MPIHDWTRVSAGTWHAFHLSWIAELQRALNQGILPEGYYAQAEQIIGPFGPDVLALERTKEINSTSNDEETCHAMWKEEIEYADKRRKLTIRHCVGDQFVSLIEIIPPLAKKDHSELPLTLVSYSSSLDADVKAFLEPTAVGRILVDMPLFLTPDDYVNVPLELTYRTAFEAVPSHLLAILDA